MWRLILRRIARSIPLLLVVSAVSFVLESLVPGNTARALAGVEATHAEYERLRIALGLNRPLWYQYGHYLTQLVFHGRLGVDAFSGQSVSHILAQRLPVTLSLVIFTTLVSAVLGIGLGVVSAVRGGVLGKFVDFMSVVGFALPAFLVGLLLQEFLSVHFRWFPSVGYVAPSQSIGGWLRALVLPVLSLSVGPMAIVAKQSRESMKDVLDRDYIRTLRASGLGRGSILWKHALRNAVTPTLTVLGLVFVSALSFTVFAENVFSLPGLGSLIVTAASAHDIPIIEGVTVYFTFFVVIVNILLDVLYSFINPRIRHR